MDEDIARKEAAEEEKKVAKVAKAGIAKARVEAM
jgi:hypothetical protein